MGFLSNLFWYVVPFLLILSVLIFVHELGHYLVAKWCGVKIEEFSLGFGKKIWGKKDKSGTEWKVCAFPFGGYVKMFGDSNGASTPDHKKLKKMTKAEKAVSFQFKKLWQRFAIVFAGPFFNYLFAILCFAILFMSYGQQFTKPIVSEILKDSPAYEAGLKKGDLILNLDGRKIEKFEDVQAITTMNYHKTMPITLNRDGSIVKLEITPETIEKKTRFGTVSKSGKIGIMSTAIEFKKYQNPVTAIYSSFKFCNTSISMTLEALGQMIVGTRSGDQLGGPLKIAQLSKEFAVQGFAAVLFFLGMLSVNLGLINLFPIPVLDGGHLLFYIVEAIIRRPVPEKIQDICYKTGLTFILLLFVFITINDLKSFAVFDYIKNLFYK